MTAATALPARTLGGLTSSAIGFGAMVLSPGVYGETDEQRATTALLSALDEGATLIDTADGYGPDGHNEQLIGRALRGRRDEVVLATKFGFRLPEGVAPHPFPVNYGFGELAVNADPATYAATPRHRCAIWGPTSSTCTTRTTRTRRFRSRTPSVPSPS
ncbi:aldo/keto reductase [Streptomyces endophytica]|uniref:Aldo/keto reductase n=1 Tax=Streptomyces endophytica TaxID=2991496 RepID=A0ABY6PC80_9ACTN|nr:aldo/keto reductase [Streptomyces endophytica]UZJ31439.1 aldo/keto reductase [Streptomyces endophytica]